MSINRDEWLSALNEAGLQNFEYDQDAITAADFAKMIGVCTTTARARLKQLVKAGKAIRVSKRVADGTERRQIVPAYRLVKDKGRGDDSKARTGRVARRARSPEQVG